MMKNKVMLAVIFCLVCLNSLFSQVVSTLAGPLGMRGDKDGTGIAARFEVPHGICFDPAGNMYVADEGTVKIKKVTPSGVVTTFAGTGSTGSADGTGTAASFNYPRGLCSDASGNIYVADASNHKIRKITPAGVVTTLAGSGVPGSANGTGSAASFNYPHGICIDAAGDLYVSESVGNRIRKVTQAGVVTTLAGSGSAGATDATGTAASFQSPTGVCADAAGTIYVSDFGNQKIRKITPAGVVTTFAGTGSTGAVNATGTAASFNGPYAICIDAAGDLYVSDRSNYKVRKITPSAVVSTFSGSGMRGVAFGPAASASFNNLSGLCAHASGDVYVVSETSIRKISPAGTVSGFVGGGGYGAEDFAGNNASFSQPESICPDAAGNVYVADVSNNKIRKITPAGVVSTFAGIAGSGSADGPVATASFYYPTGLCFDPSGNMYVSDRSNQKIRKISSGVVSTLAGGGPGVATDGTGTAASFNYPNQICSDAAGNLYVADTDNSKIRKITPAGVVTTFAGSGATGATDATGTAASFYYPYGICADASGNIYVGDTYNHKIRKITPAGVVTTFAGSGAAGAVDGTGTAASFKMPHGLWCDASGNIYVVDKDNNKIRKITPAGVVSTLAGTGVVGDTDGAVAVAEFATIYGVCTDASGSVFITVRDDNKIRKITSCSAPSAPVNATGAANAAVCAGNTTTLTATATGTISWFNAASGGTAITTGSTVVSSNTLTAGTYTYYAEAATCTVSAVRTAVSFTVNPAPTLTANSGSVCSGQSFTIVPGGAATYTYSGGSNVVTPSSGTTYSVTGTSAQGCLSANAAISSVTVHATPILTANSGSVCSGQSFTIVPGGAATYTYSGGSSVVTPSSGTSDSITGTSVQGCLSANTAVSSVTVYARPTITAGSGSVCSGQSFTIVPGGAATYTYSGGSSVVTPSSSTTYSVTGTSAQGCLSANTAVSSVTVYARPTITAGSSNSVICSGQTVTLTATGSAATYTWSTNSNSPGIVVSPTVTTTYTVNGTNAQGCTTMASVTQSVSLCTGIAESIVMEDMSIYPNPGNGLFTIRMVQKAKVILTNSLGEIVSDNMLEAGEQTMDLQDKAPGVYVVTVINDHGYWTSKLIKTAP